VTAAKPVVEKRPFLETVIAQLPPAPQLPPSVPAQPQAVALSRPPEAPAPASAAATPTAPTPVNIIGSVQRQGRIPWVEGATLRQVLDLAGGTTPLAAVMKIRVTRKRTDGSVVTFTVTTGEADTFLMSPGDVVYVPERIL
jgi:protein involved in polysaccharide export with SLBB domain